MRASGVLLVSAAMLTSIPTCTSLLGSPHPGGTTSSGYAFVPAARPVGQKLDRGRAGPGLCPLRQRGAALSAVFGRPLRFASSVASFTRPLRRAATTAAGPGWTCAYGVGGGFMEDPESWGEDDLFAAEFGEMEEREGGDWRTVLLKDSKLDRTIECFIDREIEVDGKQYATLMPADTPVIMASYKDVNGTQQLVPVLDDKTIDLLFPTASAVLSEMDLSLSRSAVVLTVEEVDDGGMEDSDSEDDDDDQGEEGQFMVSVLGPDGESMSFTVEMTDSEDSDEYDDDDDDDEILSLGDSNVGPIGLRLDELIDREAGETDDGMLGISGSASGDDDDEEEESSEEKVQVLATFYFQGEKYVVATPLEPVLIIGSPVGNAVQKQPELFVGSDVDVLKSLPESAGLLSEKQDAEDSNTPDYLLPDREELERVTPKIEQELETIWDVEEKERKVLVRLRQQLINQWGRKE